MLIDIPDQRFPTDGNLIHAICAMYHQGMLCAQAVEHRGNLVSQFLRGNTDDLKLGFGGVGEGTKDIEHSANSDFASGDSSIFHCWMEDRSKHKTDAHCLQTLGD